MRLNYFIIYSLEENQFLEYNPIGMTGTNQKHK